MGLAGAMDGSSGPTYRPGRILPDAAGCGLAATGMSLSRRWCLLERGPVRLFIGFGLSAKTESDQLSTTRLDFASQLGVRFRLPGDKIVGELTMRHWSNAGIRLPNHGEDFATLTFRVNSGLFGVDRSERIAADGMVRPARARFSDTDGRGDLP